MTFRPVSAFMLLLGFLTGCPQKEEKPAPLATPSATAPVAPTLTVAAPAPPAPTAGKGTTPAVANKGSQPVPGVPGLPDGVMPNLAAGNAATNNCSKGGCVQTCPPTGTCTLSCSGGSCAQTCPAGATCTLSCSGGSCKQTCAGPTCTKSCTGQSCT